MPRNLPKISKAAGLNSCLIVGMDDDDPQLDEDLSFPSR